MKTSKTDENDTIEISDIVTNEIFIKAVKQKLHEVVVKRNKKPALKENQRYKRDWHDRLSDVGEVTADYFIQNIPAIWTKTSNLNAEIRNIIAYVCNHAFREAYNLD